MAFLFKKSKKTETTETDGCSDRILKEIVKTCLGIQNCWAQWMDRSTKHLSRKTLIILLLAFIVLAGGYSINLIGQSLSGNQTNSFSVTPIKKPGHVLQTGDAASQTNMIVRKMDYQGIIRFRGYMDSLTLSPAGKAAYDSIIYSRPGLLDSIRLFEEIYQSQIKK